MSASSDLQIPPRFLHGAEDQDGSDAPKEWQPGRILLPGISPQDWDRTTVEVQDRKVGVRLELIGGKMRVCAEWDRADAGTWRVRVRFGSEMRDHLVEIAPAKITPAEHREMISDLERRLPASIAISLDRLGAFAGVTWTPPGLATLEQELTQVRHALEGSQELPGLAAVLHAIARHPHQVLAHQERWVRVEAARRPVPMRLAAALTRPGNLLASNIPSRVVDGRVTLSFDTYENRLVKEFADQVDRRLRRLERAAAQSVAFANNHEPTLKRLRTGFRAARRAASLLDDVAGLRGPPDRLTQVLTRRPAYRDALKGFLRFRRSARLNIDRPAADATKLNVPALYERWGTLLVVDEVLNAAGARGWRVKEQTLVQPHKLDPFIIVLAAGTLLELRNGDATAALLFQETFSSAGAGLHSISFDQRPDVVLVVTASSGRPALHVFDPKYKLSAGEAHSDPVKADIDKMHAYRDAIRASDGRRAVRSAAILYPGCDRDFRDEIGAFRSLPGSEPRALRRRIVEALEGRATDPGLSGMGIPPSA